MRLARVTYAETAGGKEPYTKLGFLLEDVDDMAARVETRELSVPRQMFQSSSGGTGGVSVGRGMSCFQKLPGRSLQQWTSRTGPMAPA